MTDLSLYYGQWQSTYTSMWYDISAFTGELDYWDCPSSCVALTGNWKVLDHYLVGSYRNEIVEESAQSWWLDHREFSGW